MAELSTTRMGRFEVQLDIFRGPLDLLLYLVRKHEVDVVDLPIAPIASQFVEYLGVLQELDVNAVGDFLEMASTLAEIKSRLVLPHGGEEVEQAEDPREDLVRRLLEYKKFRDAASLLEEQSRRWQERFPRLSHESDSGVRNLAEDPIHELELWDLVSAFGRILRDQQANLPTNIVYDDTPIHVFMSRVHGRLLEQGSLPLSSLFEPGMHKSTLVGLFLAVMELVRHYGVRAEQAEIFGEILIVPNPETAPELDLSRADNYDPQAARTTETAAPAAEAGGARQPADVKATGSVLNSSAETPADPEPST